MGEAAFVDRRDLAQAEDDISTTLTDFKKAYEDVKGTIDGALQRSIGGELAEKIKTAFYDHDDVFQGVINSMKQGEDFLGQKGGELNKLTAKIENDMRLS